MTVDDALYDVDLIMELQNRMSNASKFFNKGVPVFHNDMDVHEFELWEREFNILQVYFNEIEYKRICINIYELSKIDSRLKLIEGYVSIMIEENY